MSDLDDSTMMDINIDPPTSSSSLQNVYEREGDSLTGNPVMSVFEERQQAKPLCETKDTRH
jgi:hypothetical protein